MPVAGYPFYSKQSGVDECAMQPDSSLYKEDGSLEVSSLHIFGKLSPLCAAALNLNHNWYADRFVITC